MISLIERALKIPSRSDREYWALAEDLFNFLGISASLKTCATEVRATKDLSAVVGEIKGRRESNLPPLYSQQLRWGLSQSFTYQTEDSRLPAWTSFGIDVRLSGTEVLVSVVNGKFLESFSDSNWQKWSQSIYPKEALTEAFRHAVSLAHEMRPGPDYRFGVGKGSWQGRIVENEHFRIIF